jgi:hypothetical protein
MPLTKITKSLGIDDCKIAPLTADTAEALTYGSLVDVPGIQNLKYSANVDEKELEGDEVILDYYSKLKSFDFSVEHALISLDALAALFDTAAVATGETPNQVQTLDILGSDVPGYVKIEGQVKYGDTGDHHVVFWKAKLSKFEVENKGKDYATVSFSGKAIPTVNNSKLFSIVLNETAAAIA